MKRSEAMDKLRKLCDARDMPKSTTWLAAARDLLNAEDELPWKVSTSGKDPLAAFFNEPFAKCFVNEVNFHDDWLPLTITGPTQTVDHAEGEQTESKGDPDDVKLPRLVPVEAKPPTLDQLENTGPHRCMQFGDVVYRMYEDGQVYRVRPDGTKGHPVVKHQASDFAVLDADPIGPKTAGELKTGDIFVHHGDYVQVIDDEANVMMVRNLTRHDASGGHPYSFNPSCPLESPVYRIEP